MSLLGFSPSSFESIEKSESSFGVNFSLPPNRLINPSISCGTNHEYCQAFPSVYSLFLCSDDLGLKGVFHFPSLNFARIKFVVGSKRFL